jgi:hypothetical protein
MFKYTEGFHLAALNSAFPGAAAKFPKATEHAVDAALDALAAWQAKRDNWPDIIGKQPAKYRMKPVPNAHFSGHRSRYERQDPSSK